MIPSELVDILVCPSCSSEAVTLGAGRYPDLVCGACKSRYPVVDDIPDLIPQEGGKPLKHYRTESLFDAVAKHYDHAVLVMSLLVWKCSPLRFVDWGHRGMGRISRGPLLVNPVGTGLLLRHIYGEHRDFPIVAIDISRKMLRRAQKRFKRSNINNVTFIRAEPEHLPFRKGSFGAVMSMNGVSAFHDRQQALSETRRVLAKGGRIVGTSLCRGLERSADKMLDQYERWGIYPILRSKDYLVKELSQAFRVPTVRFETHGAVVFYVVDVGDTESMGIEQTEAVKGG